MYERSTILQDIFDTGTNKEKKEDAIDDPPFCFGCSPYNPVSLMVFNFHHQKYETKIEGEIIFRKIFTENKKDYVHPGVVSAFFKEIMGNLANQRKIFNLISDLHIKFNKRVLAEIIYSYRAEIKKVTDTGIVLEGVIINGRENMVMAKGIFSFTSKRKIDDLYNE
jgi:hypothetical protein